MFAGAYWSQREESVEQATQRFALFLLALSKRGPLFSKWFLKGASRASARNPVMFEPSWIASNLKMNRRDSGGEVMPELGFTLALWNGEDASLSATLGVYSPYVPNAVVLSFGEAPDLTSEDWKGLLDTFIREFDPEHAVVTSTEYLARHGTGKPWRAGWFTYERGGGVQEHAFE